MLEIGQKLYWTRCWSFGRQGVVVKEATIVKVTPKLYRLDNYLADTIQPYHDAAGLCTTPEAALEYAIEHAEAAVRGHQERANAEQRVVDRLTEALQERLK